MLCFWCSSNAPRASYTGTNPSPPPPTSSFWSAGRWRLHLHITFGLPIVKLTEISDICTSRWCSPSIILWAKIKILSSFSIAMYETNERMVAPKPQSQYNPFASENCLEWYGVDPTTSHASAADVCHPWPPHFLRLNFFRLHFLHISAVS